MILLVSHEGDDHALAVLPRLEEAGAAVRLLDLAEFPRRLRLSLECSAESPPAASLAGQNGDPRLLLHESRVVWWRRPQPFELDPALADSASVSFAHQECYLAIYGIWPMLEAFWVNEPGPDERAAGKPFQLALAREIGLEIPKTLITNDPERARSFSAERGAGETIYKTFSASQQAWRETRVLREEEAQLLDAVALAPVIFQEYVPAALDLRVTMIDGKPFAAAIHSQETPYKADYRMHMDEAVFEPFDLPEEVVEGLRRLMDRLGLVYGAIDLRLTPDGRYVFLEVNPSGQWLFVEERTHLPITDAFVELLLAKAGER